MTSCYGRDRSPIVGRDGGAVARHIPYDVK
jgi:hypothetical protein